MALTFYYGSGSPYAWRVWLALEHKALAYELKTVSFSAGDLTKPEYLAMNPRHKVPTIADNDFFLYESAAILEYLEEQYSTGKVLFPGSVRQRAVIRRLVREADEYLAHALERLVDSVLFTTRKNGICRKSQPVGKLSSRSSACSRATCAATGSTANCLPPISPSIRLSRFACAWKRRRKT